MAIEIVTVGGPTASTSTPTAAKRSVMSDKDAAEVRGSHLYNEKTADYGESLIAKGFKKDVVLTALEAQTEQLQAERIKDARQAARQFSAARGR